MGLVRLAAKLAEYQDRLERGKASKIKPEHVQKTLEKLRKKKGSLTAEIAAAQNEDSKARLERKLGIAREHIKRAEWLLDEIG